MQNDTLANGFEKLEDALIEREVKIKSMDRRNND